MKRIVMTVAVLVAVGLFGGVMFARTTRPAGAMRELVRALPERVFAARFSIETNYHACTVDTLFADSIVQRHECGKPGEAPVGVSRLAGAVESLDPDRMQAFALANVIWWDGKNASLDRAIEGLYDALRLAADPLPMLVNLSAVHLVRAELTNNSQDVAVALNHARAALALDPANLAALYNAALASEALPLHDQALDAWNAYLAADSTSLWANDARARRQVLLGRPAMLEAPTVSSPATEVDAYAARYPHRARELGLDSVLAGWGSAVLDGKAARADSLLRFAEEMGRSVERRGGDLSLADAVRAIRRARNPAETRTLARAHQAYGESQGAAVPAAVAVDRLTLVVELNPPSPALIGWASAMRGRSLRSEEDFKALLPRIDSVRYPALAARVHWFLGYLRRGAADYYAANQHFANAAETFGRLGEAEYFGFTRAMEGLTAYETGDTIAAYRMAREALGALRPYRNSRWLNSALFDIARYAERDGMVSAAVAIQEEGIGVARRGGHHSERAQALLGRAELRAIAGDREGAVQDLDSAAVLIDALEGEPRVHFARLLQYSRAILDVGTTSSAVAKLDSVINYFSGNQLWRTAALMLRADIHLAAEDTARARIDLDSITAQLRRMSQRAEDLHQRMAVIEQGKTRFDQLVMLHARAGRPVEALQALERGRVSFTAGSGAQGVSRSPIAAPPGHVVLEYALIGDRLLTWIIQGTSVTLVSRRVNRDELLLTIERAGAALERPRRDELALPQLERLYDELIRPVEDRLGPAETPLMILADGEIAGVPFDALRDRPRGEYLLQRHLLRFAASRADAARPLAAMDSNAVLLVADPAFDSLEHRDLKRLEGATAEVDSLRTVYRDAPVLRDSGATAASFRTYASRASVIHYAGHAVFDDTRPERSFLVLAGAGDTGRLTADSVGSMDLGSVRLVVLSACRTLRARQGRSGGFVGLSGALLNAGAGGVVGRLWDVDDRLTQGLMLDFHRAYARNPDAAAALRHAQLEMLRRSDDPPSRSPAAWAGFRYVGR